MSFRRLRVTTPDMGDFYSVVDEEYQPHELASRWLRSRYLAGGHAESTSAEYASSTALFLTWADEWDLAAAARRLHLFVAYLSVVPIESGPRRGHSRSDGRINRILVAVREFYRFGVDEGVIDAAALRSLYEVDPRSDKARARHRRKERRRRDEPPDQATAAEIVAIFERARTARDRLLVMLLSLTGLRIGQALGLRRQDVHLVPNAADLGLEDPGRPGTVCSVTGEHLHVVRRRNPNGATSKAQFNFTVPVHAIVLALYEQYLVERDGCLESADNDMVFVALRGATAGEAISARNVNKIVERLSKAAGLRHLHPHMFRHFNASGHLAAGASRDELQSLLGWSHVASADPYIHVSHERRREAVDRLAATFPGELR